MKWPQGFPVMCSENQSELGLANGDIGFIIDNNEARRILFRVSDNENGLVTCLIHPSRLKQLKPALALTIHKSQGSEAKNVFVLWPDDSRLVKDKSDQLRSLAQEYEVRLLYTAITRASNSVELFSPIGENTQNESAK